MSRIHAYAHYYYVTTIVVKFFNDRSGAGSPLVFDSNYINMYICIHIIYNNKCNCELYNIIISATANYSTLIQQQRQLRSSY